MKKSMLALKLFLLCVFIAASAANAEGNITVAAIEIVVENPDPVVVTAAPPVAVEAAVVVSDASKTVYVFPPAQTVDGGQSEMLKMIKCCYILVLSSHLILM